MKDGVIDFGDCLHETLLDVQREIAHTEDPIEKAWLLHSQGSIFGAKGDKKKQKESWEKALRLDPHNAMVKASLKSLNQ